jgi:hypothetical protein
MGMKKRDFADAQSIIDGIKTGQLTRRDLVALLIYIREHIPNDIVRDIAHCVAHSDRDRGYTYSHIESFVQHLVDLGNQGGGTLKVDPVFPKNDLITVLAKDLVALGFDIDKSDIENNYEVLKRRLSDILTDTTVKLRQPSVRQCAIEEGDLDRSDILAFYVFFQGLKPSIFHIPHNVALAFPVFSA